ncbi:uncharacterized protein SCDLUD_002968 [Saccharomycodes ludwigii]|uniref:uncharacterized protein n=1 Tax=Saccharomycodes ludwigii TaxID=36035 RepID=UPI001E8A233E|nr:hypothetical protein SCDLUD_002968 [Saccharomycodes ludwigii]KAH3901473.1 hypothetical protein SCDLUD_002968 [Saccharomycodes ludwigii]
MLHPRSIYNKLSTILAIFCLLFFFFPLNILATSPANTNYILTFSQDTPNTIVNKVKEYLNDNEGKITFEFSIINGFSFNIPTVEIDNFEKTLSNTVKWPYTLEKDQEVHIN